MATDIVKVIDHPAGERRVLIVVRADGCFGYCWQEWEGTEWSVRSISPDIYDSALSAETEARQQLAWLKVPLGPGP